MKWILLLLFVTSCSTYKIPTTVDEIPDLPVGEVIEATKPVEVVVEAPKPVEIKTTKLHIVSLTGFKDYQEARFRKIVANTEIVLNSKEYKEALLAHTWKGKRQFVDTTDSNETLVSKILKNDWNIEYKLESMRSSTVGYTYPNVKWVAINKSKFDTGYDDADIACNILHEMGGHKIGGYDHAQNWSESRDYSAPYGIGYVGEKIYRKMFMTK